MMIRTLLDVLIPLTWSLLGIAIAFYFLRSRRRHGLRVALRRLLSYRLLLPVVIVVGLTLVRAALVFIYPHEIGVVISILSERGIRPQPLPAGLHWIVPLAEKVKIYPIYWQTFTMSNHPFENEVPQDDSIKARTADGQVVIMDCTVIFRVDPKEVIRLHIHWQDRYVKDLLRPVMRSALRDKVSQYTVDEVNSYKRAIFVKQFEEKLKSHSKGSGVLIERVLIRNIAFSPEYAESVEQKQMAHQGVDRATYEAKQIENLARGRGKKIKIVAQADAAAILIEAAAAAKARVVKAEAEAKALRMVGEALNRREDLLTFRYIEKLSPNIKAMLLPSETPLILPLPQLDGQATPAADSIIHDKKSKAPETLDGVPIPAKEIPLLTSPKRQ